MRCRVANCVSQNDNKASKISFFAFPSDDVVAKKWVQFCRHEKPFNLSTSVICMKHFTDDDIENRLQYNMGFAKFRLLKRGAIPTIFEPNVLGTNKPQPRFKINIDELLKASTSKVNKKPSYTTKVNKKHLSTSKGNKKQSYISKDSKQQSLSTTDGLYDATSPAPIDDASSPTHSFFYSDSNVQGVATLESEVEILKREKEILQKQNETQRKQLFALKRRSQLEQKGHSYEMESLQKRLKLISEEAKNMEEKLAAIFTKGQIEMVKTGSKKLNWTEQDITQSITLYAASPKVYRFMYKQGFPLPAVSILKSWAKKLHISRGLIRPVFRLLASATHMDEVQRLCVLSFGEMKVRQSDCYILPDSTLAPTNYVQVAMLRGLMSKWNQPIFYDFDRILTSDLLQQILKESENCGYIIVAVVCDLEDIHKFSYNDLGITEDQPWFILNDRKIYVFADVPHLLKSLRNYFLDQGFLINGKPVNKEIISELLSCTSADLTIIHKVSATALIITEPHCQSVKSAAKLFSHTVAQAIAKAASMGHLQGRHWIECFQLLKITNDWFDLFNIRVPYVGSGKWCQPYGLAVEKQDKILDEMTALIKSMRVIGKSSLLTFQRGIIQTNKALKLLFADVKSRFNFKYILTNRLNKEVLENFFGIIRSKDRVDDYLDQEEFKYRLRLYLLGHIKGDISDFGSVEDTPDREITQQPLTSILLKNLNSGSELWPDEYAECEDLEFDGLVNLGEYI